MTKLTHGGKRPGAGRKPRTDGRKSRLVRIALTDEEHRLILQDTTVDSRRTLLLSK